MQKKVLIIEKQNSLRSNLVQHVRQNGFMVYMADQMEEVRELLAGTSIQLVLLGLGGLKREGIAILGMIRRHYPGIRVITINSADQFELSLKGMRLGAYDDFLIPFELDSLMACVHRALDMDSGREPASVTDKKL
jgi:DNA-binding NtrC family response regulator